MFLIIASLALATPLPLQQASGFQTDTTFSVQQGARLKLNNQGGDLIIKAWDKNQVRVQATHSRRTEVEVVRNSAVVEIQARASHGPANLVDYQLTVPTWMGVELGGMYATVSVEGTRGAIKAQTLEGDITVKGGGDNINLTTVNGKISVSGARGRLDLHSVSEDIDISDVQGDVTAETVSGSIRLRRVEAKSLDLQSVSGDLLYDGKILDQGSYSLLTHSGEITVSVPEGTNATFMLASASGEFSSSFPLTGGNERTSRRRQTYRLGSGSATMELETFSGEIRLVRPSEINVKRKAGRDDDEGDGTRFRFRFRHNDRNDRSPFEPTEGGAQ